MKVCVWMNEKIFKMRYVIPVLMLLMGVAEAGGLKERITFVISLLGYYIVMSGITYIFTNIIFKVLNNMKLMKIFHIYSIVVTVVFMIGILMQLFLIPVNFSQSAKFQIAGMSGALVGLSCFLKKFNL